MDSVDLLELYNKVKGILEDVIDHINELNPENYEYYFKKLNNAFVMKNYIIEEKFKTKAPLNSMNVYTEYEFNGEISKVPKNMAAIFKQILLLKIKKENEIFVEAINKVKKEINEEYEKSFQKLNIKDNKFINLSIDYIKDNKFSINKNNFNNLNNNIIINNNNSKNTSNGKKVYVLNLPNRIIKEYFDDELNKRPLKPNKIIKVVSEENTDNENFWYYIKYNYRVVFPVKGYENYEATVPTNYIHDKKFYVLSKGRQIE